MSKNQPSNATVVDKCSQRLNALKAYVTPKMQIAINGVVHKATDVIEIYQSFAAAHETGTSRSTGCSTLSSSAPARDRETR